MSTAARSSRPSSRELMVDVGGRGVRVQVYGEGPPVLLINGLGANLSMWAPLVRSLDGFQVITFDAPGTGRSAAPYRPYTVRWIADVAVRLLDALELDQVDVLGYSLGGGVAQQLAHDHPHRVRRLVLVSTTCGAGGVPGSLVALMAVMTPARHYLRAGYQAALKLIELAPAEKQSRVLQAQARDWHHGSPPSVRGYTLQMSAFSVFNSLPWLDTVTHPTLIFSGTHDRLVPAANSAILAAHLPHARLQLVQRWGHYMIHDPASGAGAKIAEFLGAVEVEQSEAWRSARLIDSAQMAAMVRDAPRSAHPSRHVNTWVRRRHSSRAAER